MTKALRSRNPLDPVSALYRLAEQQLLRPPPSPPTGEGAPGAPPSLLRRVLGLKLFRRAESSGGSQSTL